MIDVLILGAGGAGLSAALSAKNPNNKVTVISKVLPTNSQTSQAQVGINAVLYEGEDSIETHIDDTFKASKNLSNKEHIKYMCENAKETLFWLDSLGVPFNRDTSNNIAQRKFGGTKNIRTCYSSDYTGLKILHSLYDNCLNRNIDFLNEHFILKLIIEDNICKGVITYDICKGEIKEYLAKTVIIAMGGYAGIYKNHTTNSLSNSGDAIALAYKAGAEISNLEFVQFHPTTIKDKNILISESARGEGGYLVDKEGKRFIDELKPRDEVARAIKDKLDTNDKVYLDLRHLGLEKIKKILPQEYELAKYFANVELDKELLAIAPAAHYTMGGIKTNIDGETNIKNLYACGECAQNDIHGANRLGGNSLLEIITFGRRTGSVTSNVSKEIKTSLPRKNDLDKQRYYIDKLLNKDGKESFYKYQNEIGNLLFDNIGLYRDEKNMKHTLKTLESINTKIDQFALEDKSKVYNKNLLDYLEFINVLNTSILLTKSALKRKESRGSHYRVDFKNEDKNFQKNSILLDSSYDISFEEIL